jgi:hypothetical protein
LLRSLKARAVLLQPLIDLSQKLVLPLRIIDRAFAGFTSPVSGSIVSGALPLSGELADDPQRLARLFAIDLAGHCGD